MQQGTHPSSCYLVPPPMNPGGPDVWPSWISHTYKPAVFPPERAIVGISHCNQRWPPEKRKKGPIWSFLALSFYKAAGLTHAEYFKSHPFLIQ